MQRFASGKEHKQKSYLRDWIYISKYLPDLAF
jgi:hypothetical protein